MQVADEVDHETQRVGPLLWVGFRRPQDSVLIGGDAGQAAFAGIADFFNHGTEILPAVGKLGAENEVDVMPGRGFWMHAAEIVSPGGGVRHGVDAAVLAEAV